MLRAKHMDYRKRYWNDIYRKRFKTWDMIVNVLYQTTQNIYMSIYAELF